MGQTRERLRCQLGYTCAPVSQRCSVTETSEVGANVLCKGARRLFNILANQVNICPIHSSRTIVPPSWAVATNGWIFGKAILGRLAFANHVNGTDSADFIDRCITIAWEQAFSDPCESNDTSTRCGHTHCWISQALSCECKDTLLS